MKSLPSCHTQLAGLAWLCWNSAQEPEVFFLSFSCQSDKPKKTESRLRKRKEALFLLIRGTRDGTPLVATPLSPCYPLFRFREILLTAPELDPVGRRGGHAAYFRTSNCMEAYIWDVSSSDSAWFRLGGSGTNSGQDHLVQVEKTSVRTL